MFSKACEYAIKIMIYIATNEKNGRRAGLKEVAEATGSPEAFTAKILQQLVKARLLKSFRGPSGGFVLNEREGINVHDVVIAIDGERLLEDCVLGFPECSSENPCPMHSKFAAIRSMLIDTLLSTLIRDEELLSGTTKFKS